MANTKQSNITISVLSATIAGDSVRTKSDRTQARVAIYAGGAGDDRQTLWATVVIDDPELTLTKGQRIKFEGDLKLVEPNKGYEDKGPSMFLYVDADKYEVLERNESRVDERRSGPARAAKSQRKVEADAGEMPF